MLECLDAYDFAEVFGEGTGGNCTPIIPKCAPFDKVSLSTFSREDVAEVKGQSEGEPDGISWIVWGVLKDSRFFLADGSCDYTGWD